MLALSACTASIPEPEPIAYTLDDRGIQLVGQPLRIDFGRTDHSTIPAMSKLVGRAPISQSVCGEVTQVTWPEATLFFRAGDFRGWQAGSSQAGVTCA